MTRQEIIEFLRENLSVEVDISTSDSGDSLVAEVVLWIGDDVISQSSSATFLHR